MPNAVFYSINDLIEMGLVGSRTTASKLIKEGEIPAIKLGRRVLIPADELELVLNSFSTWWRSPSADGEVPQSFLAEHFPAGRWLREAGITWIVVAAQGTATRSVTMPGPDLSGV